MWTEWDLLPEEQQESLYQVLGVSILATSAEIKQAWRKQALLHHPDRHPDRDVEAKQRFQAIQHAYEILRDAVLRAEYDKELLHRLFLEEYLRRFDDLILTASGLGLPLEHESLHKSCSSSSLCFLEDALRDTLVN